MARDPQAALVALNRFGLGARGGASSDFASAASDPRGFVKAELGKPGVALLEAPGLQDTPTLAKALFDYQAEVKQQREAAKIAAANSDDNKSNDAKPENAKPENAMAAAVKPGDMASADAMSTNPPT